MNKRFYFRVLIFSALLFFLYTQGTPVVVLIGLGGFFAVLLLIRDKFWRKSESLIDKHAPFTKKWPKWAKWLIVLVLFLVIYTIAKYVAFEILKTIGVDVQKELITAINFTM